MFIKFYNSFMDDGEYRLSPKDWHLYLLIALRWSMYLDCSETTVNRLTELQQVYSQSVKSKKKVADWIGKLHNRGITTIRNIDELNDYAKTLEIELNHIGEFEQIPIEILNKSSDIVENYMICCIYRFQEWNKKNKNNNGFVKSIDGWCELLDISDRDKVRDIIRSMEERKVIKRKGWKRSRNQDTGRYSSTPYEYFIVTENEEAKSEDKKKREYPIAEMRQHKWYTYEENGDKVYPDVDDYYVLYTTDDEKLKKAAQKRIDAMEKSEFGKKKVREYSNAAKDRIKMEKNKENSKRKTEILNENGFIFKMKNGSFALLEEVGNKEDIESIVYLTDTLETEYGIERSEKEMETEFILSGYSEDIVNFILDEVWKRKEFNESVKKEIAGLWMNRDK